MSHFQSEIQKRLTDLRNSNGFEEKRKQLRLIFGIKKVDADWNDIVQLDEFQLAFLDLLYEKYVDLSKYFQAELEKSFLEMYENSDNENERAFEFKSELTLNCIQLPAQDSEDWQLLFEMMSDDTIFHVEYSGWEFKLIGITH